MGPLLCWEGPCQLQVTLLLRYCLSVALWPSRLHLHLSEEHSITGRGGVNLCRPGTHTRITPLTSWAHQPSLRLGLNQPDDWKLKSFWICVSSQRSCPDLLFMMWFLIWKPLRIDSLTCIQCVCDERATIKTLVCGPGSIVRIKSALCFVLSVSRRHYCRGVQAPAYLCSSYYFRPRCWHFGSMFPDMQIRTC